MNLPEAKLMARQLMDQNGLSYIPFKFDRSKRRLGSCRWKVSTGACVHITLSKDITLLNDVEVVRNTLLHEIAHAIVGYGNGHNSAWQRKSREIGCNANRCSFTHVRTKGRWQGVCPKCKTVFHRHRGGKGVNSVRICSCGGRFKFIDTSVMMNNPVDFFAMLKAI